MKNFMLASVAISALFAGLAPVTAAAQEIPSSDGAAVPPEHQDTDADGSASGENDIVVTALKRSSSLQDTPASIDVLDGDVLESAAINNILQITQVAPAVTIFRPPNNSVTATIRGLGTSPGTVAFEQGVALFVDDVYAARGGDFLGSLFDIERLEIVKGTQAAVLGKNTSFGALLLTTRKPGSDFAANGLVSYEFERKSKVVSGGVDIPLSDTLAVRVAGQYQDLGGFVKNRYPGPGAEKTAQPLTEYAGRITGVWEPTSDLQVTMSYSHQDLETFGTTSELIIGSPGVQNLFIASGYPELYEANADFAGARFDAGGPTRLKQKSDRARASVDYDLGPVTLTAVSGWSKFTQDNHADFDGTPGTYFTEDSVIRSEQFSQEIRFTSNGNSAFEYLFGGLYVHNKISQDRSSSTAYPGGMSGAFDSFYEQMTDTWSGFGQISYEFAPRLTLIAGGRVTSEKKTAEMIRTTTRPGPYTTVLFPPYPLTNLSRRETVVDGSASLQFEATDDITLYASYGQGSKGGGFVEVNLPANAEFDKEVARTAELGVKLRDPDGAWNLDLAGFRSTVDGFQNNFNNGQFFVVQNLDVRSTGFEVSGGYRVTDNFRLNWNGTYAKTENLSAPATQADNRLPRAPRFSGKFALDYDQPISDDMSLIFAADVTHRSKISFNLDPASNPFGKAFTTLNGSITIHSDRGFDLALVGRNITNARSNAFVFPVSFVPGPARNATPEDPRTVTLQLRFDF